MEKMKWHTKLFLWAAFLYWMFQVSRIWIDYSQYVYFWESNF